MPRGIEAGIGAAESMEKDGARPTQGRWLPFVRKPVPNAEQLLEVYLPKLVWAQITPYRFVNLVD
jgi:hypothetical protein